MSNGRTGMLDMGRTTAIVAGAAWWSALRYEECVLAKTSRLSVTEARTGHLVARDFASGDNQERAPTRRLDYRTPAAMLPGKRMTAMTETNHKDRSIAMTRESVRRTAVGIERSSGQQCCGVKLRITMETLGREDRADPVRDAIRALGPRAGMARGGFVVLGRRRFKQRRVGSMKLIASKNWSLIVQRGPAVEIGPA